MLLVGPQAWSSEQAEWQGCRGLTSPTARVYTLLMSTSGGNLITPSWRLDACVQTLYTNLT